MKIFNKKLNKEDLEQLRKRSELINQYLLVAQALQLQTNLYVKEILPKYGVDMSKDYEIDLKNGIIKEKQTNKDNK